MGQHSHLYNNKLWRQIRRELLRDEPLCRRCKSLGRVTLATVADHIEPHKGDEVKFWTGELQPLCKACHDGWKAKLENRGRDTSVGPDGWPLEPLRGDP